ncbi:hypothetical protein CALVIDRAFT_379844 [Calocera viscosa TUFC12733]|uniref:Uncharacterized protein n=1 Tax=Calocera viscosa (strain TUFC12733) TaxID=1330018 RepID=A0A167Q4I1_CALVF|nr:hypothetical protein CALVIDRAFT_379844 [Calocera viscosa TUFC12733]
MLSHTCWLSATAKLLLKPASITFCYVCLRLHFSAHVMYARGEPYALNCRNPVNNANYAPFCWLSITKPPIFSNHNLVSSQRYSLTTYVHANLGHCVCKRERLLSFWKTTAAES